MSYQYHGTTDLIALPNRTVQTFPSGLVRVERSFVCRKEQVARFRNTIKVNEPMPFDDGAPSIDGLYIFPEPQEAVRDDGFVEFRVTAYGRTIIAPDENFTKAIISGTYRVLAYGAFNGSSVTVIPAAELSSLNEIYTFRFVAPTTESASAVLTAPRVDNPVVIDKASGNALVPGDVSTGPFIFSSSGGPTIQVVRITTTSIGLSLQSYDCLNFGRWMEYTSSWEAKATIQTVEIRRFNAS